MLCAHFTRTAAVLMAALALPCAAQLAYDFEPEALPLDRIIGTPVHSTRGEPLGSIKDLVVDTRTGKVEFVAIERPGGQAGVVLYPVSALVAGDRGEVVLDPHSAGSSAAGASSLAPNQQDVPTHANHAFAARDLGASHELVLELPDGNVRLAPK